METYNFDEARVDIKDLKYFSTDSVPGLKSTLQPGNGEWLFDAMNMTIY